MHKIIQLLLIVTILLPIQSLIFNLNSSVFALNSSQNMEENADIKTKLAIAQFRNENRLLFVYTSQCPYCHKFAQVLDEFSKNNNIQVASLTHDGSFIAPFNNAVKDIKRINALNVTAFPVLFVENKKTKKTTLITSSLVSYNALSGAVKSFIIKKYKTSK